MLRSRSAGVRVRVAADVDAFAAAFSFGDRVDLATLKVAAARISHALSNYRFTDDEIDGIQPLAAAVVDMASVLSDLAGDDEELV